MGESLQLISGEDKLVVSVFPHVCALKVTAGLTCIVRVLGSIHDKNPLTPTSMYFRSKSITIHVNTASARGVCLPYNILYFWPNSIMHGDNMKAKLHLHIIARVNLWQEDLACMAQFLAHGYVVF